jgi:hypothetical protein
MLYWAAPTLLNPHLAVAPKDFESSQLFYEPLADIDTEGNIVPVRSGDSEPVQRWSGARVPGGVAAEARGSRGTTGALSPPTTSFSHGNTPATGDGRNECRLVSGASIASTGSTITPSSSSSSGRPCTGPMRSAALPG